MYSANMILTPDCLDCISFLHSFRMLRFFSRSFVRSTFQWYIRFRPHLTKLEILFVDIKFQMDSSFFFFFASVFQTNWNSDTFFCAPHSIYSFFSLHFLSIRLNQSFDYVRINAFLFSWLILSEVSDLTKTTKRWFQTQLSYCWERYSLLIMYQIN